MLLAINATFSDALSAINYYEYTLRLPQLRFDDIATLMSNDSRFADTFASHIHCTHCNTQRKEDGIRARLNEL